MSEHHPKLGDIIMVKVGGKEYETLIDPDGVQRFRQNTALRAFVDEARERGMTLNEMADLYERPASHRITPVSQRDYAEFYMALGYSVCGFSDLSFFQDMEIENPLWAETTPPGA